MDVVETKQSRLRSKSCNPYWLVRNQTLLVISLSYWQWGNSPAWCYPQGEWRGTALQDIQGAFVLRCHLLDLSCRAVLGFRGVSCNAVIRACPHLPPDVCFQLSKTMVGQGAIAVNTSPLRGIPLSQPPQPMCYVPMRLMPGKLPRGVKDPPEDFFRIGHWETKLLLVSLVRWVKGEVSLLWCDDSLCSTDGKTGRVCAKPSVQRQTFTLLKRERKVYVPWADSDSKEQDCSALLVHDRLSCSVRHICLVPSSLPEVVKMGM